MNMKYLLALSIIAFNICAVCSQDTFSKISLSGFEVSLIPSDEFSIHIEDSIAIKKVIKGDTLQMVVVDQTGRVPKGSITIYTNKLCFLDLHNCNLVMKEQIICNSLNMITASSFGILNVKANWLAVNIAAGSSFKIEGEAQLFDCAVGGASTLHASDLIVNQANVNVMGYSRLSFNAEEVLDSHIENSTVQNNYK